MRPRVFSMLPRGLLDPILALGQARVRDGDAVGIGEPGAELLLVLEGTVRVERLGRSIVLGVGELIGEIEVLDEQAGRIADIHAEGPVRCVAVSREQLLGALAADPRAAIALIEVLASIPRVGLTRADTAARRRDSARARRLVDRRSRSRRSSASSTWRSRPSRGCSRLSTSCSPSRPCLSRTSRGCGRAWRSRSA